MKNWEVIIRQPHQDKIHRRYETRDEARGIVQKIKAEGRNAISRRRP
jgi:hypothetical protein